MPLLIFDVEDENGDIVIRNYLTNMPVLKVPRDYAHWDLALQIAKERAEYVEFRHVFYD